MSKPMTTKQIKEIEMKVAGSTSPLADDVIALLMEVQRLKRLAKPNRAPKTRTVKILHRYESWSDGRNGIEHGKRVEDAITCPAKDSGCPECKRRNGSFYEIY